MKIAIIGYGWVGKAQHKLFPNAYVYDVLSGSKDEVNKADIAFICVPTPNPNKGRLDISVVEECVSWCECPVIVIRSTINPHDADSLAYKYNKRIVVQPEYLGETTNHPMLDPQNRRFMVLGGEAGDRKIVIEAYQEAYNANISIRQVTRLEAEIIKLSENRAIAFKVAQCQELYDACEKEGVDYYTIRDAVYGDDPRFNLWWTFIYPNKRGFNSKCIPKDVYAWASWAESTGYSPDVTNALLKRNERWISNK